MYQTNSILNQHCLREVFKIMKKVCVLTKIGGETHFFKFHFLDFFFSWNLIFWVWPSYAVKLNPFSIQRGNGMGPAQLCKLVWIVWIARILTTLVRLVIFVRILTTLRGQIFLLADNLCNIHQVAGVSKQSVQCSVQPASSWSSWEQPYELFSIKSFFKWVNFGYCASS